MTTTVPTHRTKGMTGRPTWEKFEQCPRRMRSTDSALVAWGDTSFILLSSMLDNRRSDNERQIGKQGGPEAARSRLGALFRAHLEPTLSPHTPRHRPKLAPPFHLVTLAVGTAASRGHR